MQKKKAKKGHWNVGFRGQIKSQVVIKKGHNTQVNMFPIIRLYSHIEFRPVFRPEKVTTLLN